MLSEAERCIRALNKPDQRAMARLVLSGVRFEYVPAAQIWGCSWKVIKPDGSVSRYSSLLAAVELLGSRYVGND